MASSAEGNRFVAAVNGGGIYARVGTNIAPFISILVSDANVLLSWGVPSVEFVLQERSETTASNWTNVETAPTLIYTTLQYEVKLPLPASNTFYRLSSR